MGAPAPTSFVKDVVTDGGTVSLTIELTTPACPVKDQMRDQAVAAVQALLGACDGRLPA
jgi:ATP-binding protein involved in chromosome partitioning